MPAWDARAETAEPIRTPTLQNPCRLDITERPNSFSTRTPSAFIAMSASPATAPKTSRTAQSTASDVGSAGRTRQADQATIVTVTNGRSAKRWARRPRRHREQGADPRHEQRDPEVADADADVRAIHGMRAAKLPVTHPCTANTAAVPRRARRTSGAGAARSGVDVAAAITVRDYPVHFAERPGFVPGRWRTGVSRG